MQSIKIIPYCATYRDKVLDLTIEAWTPGFAKTAAEVPQFVYDAFYPEGWQVRQRVDVGDLLDAEPQNVWLAITDGTLLGFMGLRFHPEDRMGEVHILAVAPEFQGCGIARRLMQFAESRIKAKGLDMVMVETIGDSGHAPARRAYEAFGFQSWPVARYFKKL